MYIRTKNHIYKVESETYNKQGYYIDRYEEDVILKKQVIKQDDTIEELCDEFVVIRDSTKINQLVRTDNIEYLKEMIKEDKRIIEVKGAVWTDKGLIFVARMNDKGELELI